MATSPKKSGFRWLTVIVLVISVIVLAAALLPTVASSRWGREKALALAGPHIPGTLRVDDWSLSWLDGQILTGIGYDNAAAGLRAEVAEVRVANGLLGLLLDRGDLGTLTVQRPDIQVTLPEPAAPSPSSPPPPAPAETPPGSAAADPAPAAQPALLPPLSGRLTVAQGTLTIVRPGQGPEAFAKDIEAAIDIDSSAGEITYTLALASAAGPGNLSGDGTIAITPAPTLAASLHPTGTFKISGWDLAGLVDIGATYAPLPGGRGALDATLTFAGAPAGGLQLNGTMAVDGLELAGGPLGDDRPRLGTSTMVFAATAAPGTVDLSSLTLTSPLADGTLAARVDAGELTRMSADLQVDLAEVARQFPATLKLQQGLEVTGGSLEVKAEASTSQPGSSFSVDGLVAGLAGVRAGRAIGLTEPFAVKLVGSRGENGLTLNHFSLTSSFLKGEGQGTLNDLQLSVQADLARGLAEISQFVALQEYQADGQLDFSVAAKRSDADHVGLTARLTAENLLLKNGRTVLIPGKPLHLESQADLLLTSDFAFGGVASADLRLRSWLGTSSLTGRDILVGPDRRLQTIGEVALAGNLGLGDLSVLLKSLGALPGQFALNGAAEVRLKASAAAGRYRFEEVAIASPKLSLSREGVALIPAKPLQINGRAELTRAVDGSIGTIDNPDFTYQSWLGNGLVKAARFVPAGTRLEGFSFSGSTDLDGLAALLGGLELLPPGLSFGGRETSSLTMDYSPERIELGALRTEIDDFVLSREGKTYRDKRLVLETAGAIDLRQRQMALAPVHIDSANGAASFEHLAVTDWDKLPDTLASTGQARFDLHQVLNAAADWVSLPADSAAAADIVLNWEVAGESTAGQRYRLGADLATLSLSAGELRILENEQAALQLEGSRNPASGDNQLTRLILTSPLLNADASGRWKLGEAGPMEAAFSGDLALDLGRIAALVRGLTEVDLEMAGTSASPFDFSVAVAPEQRLQWWRHANFSGALQADMIRILGIDLRSLQIPVHIADGQARAEISGRANQGALLLQPHLDLTATPPLLTIPDGSRVLDDMQITPEMANGLLARIHPLFMAATQASGSVDLELQQFSWPLGKENLNQLQFAGTMDLDQVRLGSSALLGDLLQLLRVEDTELDLSGRQIRFACKDGRVETNPLRTDIEDTELVLSGTLGLDTTIDYLAEVGVTEKLVGGDLFNYLEGTTIRVPIGGTLAKPDVSAKTVERAVADLVKQAGQKKLGEAAGNLLKGLF